MLKFLCISCSALQLEPPSGWRWEVRDGLMRLRRLDMVNSWYRSWVEVRVSHSATCNTIASQASAVEISNSQ